jgi:hypothetical protein
VARRLRPRLRPLAVLGAGALLCGVVPAVGAGTTALSSAGAGAGFEVGAADADVTPPALDTSEGEALDAAAFVPACGTSEAQIAQLWPGKRLFAFTEPYRDLFGTGQYVPGDPYCDADGSGRYEAPYLAGGSGADRWPETSADPATNGGLDLTDPVTHQRASADPIEVHAVVFDVGGTHVAMVSVDSIGVFDDTFQQIRAAVAEADPELAPNDIFFSSTHDESAPDPIGLWGPDLSQEPAPVNQANGALPTSVASGVDGYYMHYLVQRAAQAIEAADAPGTLQPALLRVVTARMPSNAQSCWSSYPFVDTDLMPVMQAVDTRTGKVIFTLVNVGTHDETLGFSGEAAYAHMLSGDWAGAMAQDLERYYGGVGMEMAGLVGSVETPAVYPPLGADGAPLNRSDGVYEGAGGRPDPSLLPQVPDVPGAWHEVPGNPTNGCSSVYPEPVSSSGAPLAPVTDALHFLDVYAASVTTEAAAALAGSSVTTVTPGSVDPQTRWMCVELENEQFAAAFAAGLFPGRTAYADPGCTVGASLGGEVAGPAPGTAPATMHPPTVPLYLETEVGVLTLGPVQIAYSPGEVFPFTEVGGSVDDAQMPFPTDCYQPSPVAPTDPAAADYTCGAELPDTAMVSGEMTTPLRFLAGLGEDMIGYMFPPGNFVGSVSETLESPWNLYEDTTTAGQQGVDRFGYGHPDDSESVGPYVGLSVTGALSALLGEDGAGDTVVPGLFVDAQGHRCDSPFPAGAVSRGDAAGSWVSGCTGFTGAVGVEVVRGGSISTISVVPGGSATWATYFATPDAGTPATFDTPAYPYSTATRGVIVHGTPLLIDVFSGADDLGGLS